MKIYMPCLAFLLMGFLTACGKQDRPYELPKEYSVDLVVTSGSMKNTIKTFASGKMARSETEMMGQKQVSIIKENKMYALLPDKKYIVMEMPQESLNNLKTTGDEAKWEKIGNEEIEGESLIKWQVSVQITNQPPIMTFFWTDKKTGYPRRSQAGDAVIKWENFKAGPQDASLFEVPAGYSKMEMPTGQ